MKADMPPAAEQSVETLPARRSTRLARDLTIDVLRGLAIFTMVAANLAAAALAEPHPFWLRLVGSFAAPSFVVLSGMMVASTTRNKGHGVRYFLIRGAVVVLIAALLDVLVWRVYPFVSFDVLYLIGVSLPLARLSLRLSHAARWWVVGVILTGTPVLQYMLGYASYPTELYVGGGLSGVEVPPRDVINHWFLDGWFPLFPWLAFALLGVQLSDLRETKPWRAPAWFLTAFFVGGVVLAVGALVWWWHPGDLLTRGGYSELFYPPTLGYVLTAVGLVVLLLAAIDRKPEISLYRPLRLLGESALLMYVLHILAIKFLIAPVWSEESPELFAAAFAGMVVALLAVAYTGRIMKARWKHQPLPVRVLLGS